jgi:hypothetical protein
MKLSAFLFLLMAGILISGCVSHKPKASASVPKGAAMIITPDASLAAKVISYNEAGRFVVLSFPIRQMPNADQIFFLYRGGLKTGEVKITGPQDDNNNIVADVVAGDAQVGDEVRNQ